MTSLKELVRSYRCMASTFVHLGSIAGVRGFVVVKGFSHQVWADSIVFTSCDSSYSSRLLKHYLVWTKDE